MDIGKLVQKTIESFPTESYKELEEKQVQYIRENEEQLHKQAEDRMRVQEKKQREFTIAKVTGSNSSTEKYIIKKFIETLSPTPYVEIRQTTKQSLDAYHNHMAINRLASQKLEHYPDVIFHSDDR